MRVFYFRPPLFHQGSRLSNVDMFTKHDLVLQARSVQELCGNIFIEAFTSPPP